MIDYVHKDIFSESSIDKQLIIETDDRSVSITNTELYAEAFELTESLCSSDSLELGACESDVVKFTVANVFTPIHGQWINVSLVLNKDYSNPLNLGRYKVDSDKPTADRVKREVTAYDEMHDILIADVTTWHNELVFPMSVRDFRDAFFQFINVEQEEIELINDDLIISSPIDKKTISGKDIICPLCEINACFGNISREGKFRYVYLEPLKEGIYPSTTLYPRDNLYPRDPIGEKISRSTYIPPCRYEDYIVREITGISIQEPKNDIVATVGNTENEYIIQDNFIVSGKTADELSAVATSILSKLEGIRYRPFSTKASGNPCIEVGDIVRLSTKTQRIEAYVLERKLSGIQALTDTYTAEGKEYFDKKLNSTAQAISKLQSQTSSIERDVVETNKNLEKLGNETTSKFAQTDHSISLEVTRAQEAEASLSVRAGNIESRVTNFENETSTNFSLTNNAIDFEVTRAQRAESNLSARADSIELQVSNLETFTESKLTQTDNAITAEVNRATNAESDLSSRLALTLTGISMSVKDGSTSASLELSITREDGTKVSQGTVELTGLVTFKNLSEAGTTAINGANITTGIISADRIVVDGWTIDKKVFELEKRILQLENIVLE